MKPDTHNDTIRSSFSTQAQNFADSQLTLSNQQYIQWILNSLPMNQEKTTVDFACGTGIMARSIAPFVKEVIGLDVTEAMVAEARALATVDGLTNINFRECAIESFDEASVSCDLAITRFSLHHFVAPAALVAKMARVVRRQGHVAIIDLLSPVDSQLGASYNLYERLRDPSHIRALTFDELRSVVGNEGLDVIHTDAIEVDVNVECWLGLTKTPEAVGMRIVSDLAKDIAGGGPTGMSPFRSVNGELMFRQNWGLVVAVKP
jgi:ubiquinone/menaquinone biosynthesis C-methylase UbiE